MPERLHEPRHAGLRESPLPASAPHDSGDGWHESLGMALHDLAGALSIVHGTVQLWRLGARLHASPADDWASVHAASERAVRLSRELLDLCHLRHSGFQLERRPVELFRLVRDVADRQRASFEAAGRWLWLESPTDDAPLWVHGDPDRLERVLDNLLDNAAKYTAAGGHVTLSVDRLGDEAVVRVRDTGVGIPPEFLPHVFAAFTREDSPAVRDRPGSGVGLLAVRRIIELHGGRVEAASRGRGTGSEFTARLPLFIDPGTAPGGGAAQ